MKTEQLRGHAQFIHWTFMKNKGNALEALKKNNETVKLWEAVGAVTRNEARQLLKYADDICYGHPIDEVFRFMYGDTEWNSPFYSRR